MGVIRGGMAKMAEAMARLNYLRMSPRKVRAVAQTVKGRKVQEAFAILEQSERRASRHLLKLLRSAVANANENHDMDPDALVVKNVLVDEGPTLKRWMPRAMGRATPIRKRTCKITIIVAEPE